MMMMMFRARQNHTACVRHAASHVLELHGSVMDMEPVRQQMINPVQNFATARGRHILNQDVTAQRMRSRSPRCSRK